MHTCVDATAICEASHIRHRPFWGAPRQVGDGFLVAATLTVMSGRMDATVVPGVLVNPPGDRARRCHRYDRSNRRILDRGNPFLKQPIRAYLNGSHAHPNNYCLLSKVTLYSRRNERRTRLPIQWIGMLIATIALLALNESVVFAQDGSVSQDASLSQPPLSLPLLDLPLTAQDGQLIEAMRPTSAHWWDLKAVESVLDQPTWVSFGLDTVLLDTIDNSPRIKILSSQASVAIERIVQQDAVFDASVLFDSRANRNNDPVGNTLTTGGPPRLIEEGLTTTGGVQRTTRRGGVWDISQELGLANSNSTFFLPLQQGNSRLSLSLNQPLMSRSGQFYNERLLAQARVDSRVSWQDMRAEVEGRISEVVVAYWRLYELRCHYLQTLELLERGKRIETFLSARAELDAGQIELAKIRGRIARRVDTEVRLRAEIKKQQAALAVLVGSDELTTAMSSMEMIPSDKPSLPSMTWNLRDAVQMGLENRMEIRSATAQLEAAALSIRVTRAELEPQLSAVFETYLAGLNGNNRVLDSFTDQFSTGGPGLAAGLQYQMPYGRRAARSRHREAQHRYQIRSEELREVVQQTQADIEIALVTVKSAAESQETKKRLMVTSIAEEEILTGRWEALAGDGASVGVVLETLLDTQSRRTDAEGELVSSEVDYVIAVVQLQRAMGTLLTQTGVTPVQEEGSNSVHFVSDGKLDESRRGSLIKNQAPQQPPQQSSRQSPQQWLQQPLGHDENLIEEKPFDLAKQGDANTIVYVEQPTLEPPANSQSDIELTQPVTTTRNDVDQLIDNQWLEESMYGDPKVDLTVDRKSIEGKKR